MKKCLMITALAIAAVPALADNDARALCVLEYMPGVQNDVVADAVVKYCNDAYYGSKRYAGQSKAAATAYNGAFDCLYRNAASSRSEDAVEAIEDACDQLYDNAPNSVLDY